MGIELRWEVEPHGRAGYAVVMGAPDASGAAVPPSWQYLELTHDMADPTRVVVDGVPLDDGRTVSQVVAGLGAEGWEMVNAATGGHDRQVLWFKRLAPPATIVPHVATPVHEGANAPQGGPVVPSATTGGRMVILTAIGNARFDRDLHERLVASVSQLGGHSGWRATRIVDKAPRTVVEDVPADEAERIAAVLQALGATVEIR